jgi:hypothetical protein
MSRTLVLIVGFVASVLIVGGRCVDQFIDLSQKPDWLRIIVQFGPASVAVVLQWWLIVAGRPKNLAIKRLLFAFWADVLKEPSNARVSVLLIRQRRWFHIWCWFSRGRTPKEWARVVRRVPKDGQSQIFFLEGEGLVGKVWAGRQPLDKQDLPDFEANETDYVRFVQKNLNMSEEKVRLLGKKCRSYVCAPIFEGADKMRLRGFVSVDSTAARAFNDRQVNDIKQFAKYLGYFLFGGGPS